MHGYENHTSNLHETLGWTAGTAQGVTMTSGAVNTKGAYVSIGTTGLDYESLTLFFSGIFFASHATLDLAISTDATNFNIIAQDLRFDDPADLSSGTTFELPLHVPRGAHLYARISSPTTSDTGWTYVIGHAQGIGGAPGYSICEAIYTAASSQGVSVDPGAVAFAKSAWVQIKASSANDYRMLMGFVGHDAHLNSANARYDIDIGIGGAGSEDVLIADFCAEHGGSGTQDARGPLLIGPWPCDIPAATRFAARGACNLTTTDRTFDIALWGFR